MKIFSRFPVFRMLLPFASGIFFSVHYPFSLGAMLTFAAISFFVAYFFTIRNYASGKYAQRWLAGIPFYCCFFSLGCCITRMSENVNRPDHFHRHTNASLFVGEIVKDPVITIKGYRFITAVSAVKIQSVWKPASGNLAVFIADSLHNFHGRRGTVIAMKGNAVTIPAPSNPDAFDARRYYASMGAWYQFFGDGKSIRLLYTKQHFNLFRYADNLRDLFLAKLKKHLGNNELGVAGALLLGYEDWLDPELENSWSAAGVLHVLCVSGMHVMLIYAILAGLLSWMEKKKWLRHIRYLLLLSMIWFYAMVTGFSPSVIRAAAMISFVIAGNWINREASVYNLMCSSCFLLFMMDPYLLFSAGFQLSFLAVCGIIFLHPLILGLWNAPNLFLHKCWELISISTAAQLATFPLSLMLFHQFPNYFLLANLLIIPLSTVIMYSGLLLLVTDWIPYSEILTGTVTSYGIRLLNYLVTLIGEIPGAITRGIWLSGIDTLLLYVLLISVTSWLVSRNSLWMFASLWVVVFLLAGQVCHNQITSQQREFVVFDSRGNSLVSIINGWNAVLLTEKSIKPKAIQFAAEEYLVKKKAMYRKHVLVSKEAIYMMQQTPVGTVILLKGWMNESVNLQNTDQPVLVIGKPVNAKAEAIFRKFNPKLVILDSSCNYYQVQKLTEAFKKFSVPVYSVSRQGAFVHTNRSLTDFRQRE